MSAHASTTASVGDGAAEVVSENVGDRNGIAKLGSEILDIGKLAIAGMAAEYGLDELFHHEESKTSGVKSKSRTHVKFNRDKFHSKLKEHAPKFATTHQARLDYLSVINKLAPTERRELENWLAERIDSKNLIADFRLHVAKMGEDALPVLRELLDSDTANQFWEAAHLRGMVKHAEEDEYWIAKVEAWLQRRFHTTGELMELVMKWGEWQYELTIDHMRAKVEKPSLGMLFVRYICGAKPE